MDYKKIAKLQIAFMTDLEATALTPNDKIKFGRTLISNYKKAKQIMKSKVQVEGDWEAVLEVCKVGLEKLVTDIEKDLYHTDEISASFVIGYVELLSQIQFLNFTDETQHKFVDSSWESEIDMSLFEDIEI